MEVENEAGSSVRKKCTTRYGRQGYRSGTDFPRYITWKGNAQYVRYEESSVTGLDGVKTTIKSMMTHCIAPNRGC